MQREDERHRHGGTGATNSSQTAGTSASTPPAAKPSSTTPTVVFRCSTRNTVYEVLKKRPGWVETQDDVDWDLCWADVGWVRDMYDQIQMDDDQRLNHFPNHYELTRKDLMVKNLKRMRKQLERNDCQTEATSYWYSRNNRATDANV